MLSEAAGLFFFAWEWLVSIQRTISLELADILRGFAQTRDWAALASLLPHGIVFGAVHAMTPGHSKTILALFIGGTGASARKGIVTACILSTTHVLMSVAIVALALPVVSFAFGGSGRPEALEFLSRLLLGVVGLWLLIASFRGVDFHRHQDGAFFGIAAGLIPCPLTLFVMTFAVAKGVPEAGLAFVAMMLVGVAAVLTTTAMLAVAARNGLAGVVAVSAPALLTVSRLSLGVTGALLIAFAANQLLG